MLFFPNRLPCPCLSRRTSDGPKAVERFGDVSDRLKASGQTFEQSKQNAAGAVLKFNEAKQRR